MNAPIRPSPLAVSFPLTAAVLALAALGLSGSLDRHGVYATLVVAAVATVLALLVRLARRWATRLDRRTGLRGLVSIWLIVLVCLAIPALVEQILDGAWNVVEALIRLTFLGGLSAGVAVATVFVRKLAGTPLEARAGSTGLLLCGLVVAGFAASPYVAGASRLGTAAVAFCVALAATPAALTLAWEVRVSERRAWRWAGGAVALVVLLATAWFTLFAFHRLYPRVHLAANVFAALAAAALVTHPIGLAPLGRRAIVGPLVAVPFVVFLLGTSEVRHRALERTPLGHALCYTGIAPGKLFTNWSTPSLAQILPLAGDLADDTAAPPPIRGVVIVTVDALRADRFVDPSVMPATFAWFEQGTRFKNARTAYTSTYACLRSIARGQYRSWDGEPGRDVRLFDLFAKAGYWTATINLPLDRSKMGRVDTPLTADDNPVGRAEVTALALDLLERIDDKPFLIWVHYYDAHSPIQVPDDLAAEAHTHAQQYDAALRGIDREIAELFACLDRKGLTDETVTVFFSDHGEEQREHGGTFHNTSVYGELARVPFAFRGPGITARTSAEDVSLVDLWQTLARTIGEADPALPSIDLWPVLRGGPDRERRIAVELDSEARQRHRAVIGGGWKIVRNETSRTIEVYDLNADPLEQAPMFGPLLPIHWMPHELIAFLRE